MEVIALIGRSDSGKTTTLKKLIFELCINRGAIIQNVQGMGRCSTFITPKRVVQNALDKYMNQHLDVTIVIEYNNKRIGITTIGDGWELIKEQFDRMGICDVLICACHNNQKVLNAMSKYKNLQGCSITSIEKIYQVKCIQDKADSKIQKCYELSDHLTVEEIIEKILN